MYAQMYVYIDAHVHTQTHTDGGIYKTVIRTAEHTGSNKRKLLYYIG
jgi:hypothetical protein